MPMPGGRRLTTSDGSTVAAWNPSAVIGTTFSSSRAAIWATVKPSGNVTLLYVWAGGVRSRASTLPMWSLVAIS